MHVIMRHSLVPVFALDRTGADQARSVAHKVGESLQEGVRKTGEAIKDAVHPH